MKKSHLLAIIAMSIFANTSAWADIQKKETSNKEYNQFLVENGHNHLELGLNGQEYPIVQTKYARITVKNIHIIPVDNKHKDSVTHRETLLKMQIVDENDKSIEVSENISFSICSSPRYTKPSFFAYRESAELLKSYIDHQLSKNDNTGVNILVPVHLDKTNKTNPIKRDRACEMLNFWRTESGQNPHLMKW